MLVICANCGIEFEKTPTQIRNTNNNFCSRVCANRYQSDDLRNKDRPGENTPEFVVTCGYCGKIFVATAKNRTRKFCSRECFGKSLIGKPGHKQPNRRYDGTYNTNYKNGNNKATAFYLARAIYGNKCVICGFDVVVNSHHIIPRNEGGKNSPDNLVTLCPNHHAMAHKNLITREELKNIALSVTSQLPGLQLQ